MIPNYTKNSFSCLSQKTFLFLVSCSMLLAISSYGQTSTYSTAGTYSFTVPAGVTSLKIEAWGGGAGGPASAGPSYRRGGGGGAYAGESAYTVVPGTSYTVTVGAGGSLSDTSAGGLSSFGSIVVAKGASTYLGGTAAASTGSIRYSGGNGGTTAGTYGNGGGGSGGAGGAGGVGGAGTSTGGVGGTAGAAGSGTAGGTGGIGGYAIAATGGSFPGGGGGERSSSGGSAAGAGGQVKVSYTCPTYSLTSTTWTTACVNSTASIKLNGLTDGTYTVTYNTSLPSQTGLTATLTSSSGAGTFTATGFGTTGSSTVTITNVASGSCSSTISSNNTVAVLVGNTSNPVPNTYSTTVCKSSTSTFSIAAVANASSYSWTTAATGWTISPASDGLSASVYFSSSATAGNLVISATNGCGSNTASINIGFLSSSTVSAASSSPTVCINNTMTTIAHTTSGATGIGSATGLPTGVSASFSSNIITISGTPSVSGTFAYSIPLTGGCSGGVSATGTITVNAEVAAPTIGTITQPTCGTTTGSVVLTGLPSSGTWTLNRVGASNSTTTGTGTTTTITGLDLGNYTFYVSYGGCTSVASTSVFISSINRWDGTSWNNGVPNSDQRLIFNGNYNSTGDLEGCTCQVNAGNTVNINSGHTLTLTKGLEVVGSASMVFFDSASLVQINNVTNTGAIEYRRSTNNVRATDYVYWSSPVANQSLGEIATQIANGIYYSYDSNIQNWSSASSATVMGSGSGYIVRRPAYVSGVAVATETYTASFVGVPTNGDINLTSVVSNKDYLVGNPYPSAINADDFLTTNSGSINGTLYLWTQNTEIQLASNITDGTAGSGYYAYTSNDYATYNSTGGVGTSAAKSGGSKPNGYLAAGQGFFCSTQASPTSSTIVFSNSMRRAGTTTSDDSGINEQFFKTSGTTSKTTTSTEKSRIWLNLTNTQGAFKQTLIGYITEATNGFDTRFDGASYDGNDYIDFYSINEDTNLTIQGRALPFSTSDEVPLGYKSTIEGDFTISIDETDGSLADQAVYLEDKVTSTVSDLKTGDYTFTTTAGTFNDRFVLVYKNGVTLSTTDFESSTESVIVSCKSNTITVNSDAETLDQIFVYDLLGRQLYKAKDVNSKEYSMTNLGSHQALLVKVILENGTIVTKKIVY
jgi:hypothetical protein